jgi:hypothetical protein
MPSFRISKPSHMRTELRHLDYTLLSSRIGSCTSYYTVIPPKLGFSYIICTPFDIILFLRSSEPVSPPQFFRFTLFLSSSGPEYPRFSTYSMYIHLLLSSVLQIRLIPQFLRPGVSSVLYIQYSSPPRFFIFGLFLSSFRPGVSSFLFIQYIQLLLSSVDSHSPTFFSYISSVSSP